METSRTDGIVVSNIASARAVKSLEHSVATDRRWSEPQNFFRREREYKGTLACEGLSPHIVQQLGMLRAPRALISCRSLDDWDQVRRNHC